MKNSNTWKYSLFFLALLAFALAPRIVYGGAYEETSNGQNSIHWPVNTTISYVVNPSGVAGFTTDVQKLVVVGAVDDAFRVWTKVPGAAIHFSSAGITSQTGTAPDAVNVVSFQDPNSTISFPPGVLAITRVSSAPQVGPIQVGTKVINAQFIGQIMDADIVFNPSIAFSPIGKNGAADLVAILEHEVGHLLGLDHTGVLSSIMSPFGESGNVSASRQLQSDDMVTAASIYPDGSANGSISGVITTSSGAAVKSADVVAVSVPAGVPVGSQLSGADGSFRIAGLPAGNYQIMVEPLDGPVGPSNFPGFYSSGQTNFATTFFGGTANPAPVSVAAGQTATANVTVPAAPANLLNILYTASALQGASLSGVLFAPGAQYLPRGNTYQLLAVGNNVGASSSFKFTAPVADVSPQGGTTGTNATVSGMPVVQQNITVSPTAALGPSDFSLSDGNSTSATAGGIVVTNNPQIDTSTSKGVLDTAGYGKKISPGVIFYIEGTDLATKSEDWGGVSPVYPNAAAPTTLGGISVKITDSNNVDRFAPLLHVEPGKMTGLIPYEAPVGAAKMTIVTGPNAAGNTVNLTLSPSSPGLIWANACGAPCGGIGAQGAILNAAELSNGQGSFVAPAGTPIGTAPAHPAKPGDVVSIYAVGLGPVTAAANIPAGCVPAAIASGTGSATKDAAGNATCVQKVSGDVRVAINGQQVSATTDPNFFAFLVPGYVGLFQINVTVPQGTPAGNNITVQAITVDGQSNTVTMAVGN